MVRALRDIPNVAVLLDLVLPNKASFFPDRKDRALHNCDNLYKALDSCASPHTHTHTRRRPPRRRAALASARHTLTTAPVPVPLQAKR